MSQYATNLARRSLPRCGCSAHSSSRDAPSTAKAAPGDKLPSVCIRAVVMGSA